MSDWRVKLSPQARVYVPPREARAQVSSEVPVKTGGVRGPVDEFVGTPGARGRSRAHLLDGGTSSVAMTHLLQAQTPTPEPTRPTWDPEAGQAFLNDGETWSPVDVPYERYAWLGEVRRQDDSVYLIEPDAQAVREDDNANWCATLAWDFLGAAVPGWSSQATRDGAAADYEKTSSEAVWAQVVGQQVPEAGLAVSLPVSSTGESLDFKAVETFTSETDTSMDSPPTLTSLADIPVGESRAIVMRPLNGDGTSNGDATGHWVIVERVSEDEYRIHQSAPGNWVMAGMSAPQGGTFTQTFTGPDAAQQVSDCVQRQSRFAAENQGSSRYGLVVLEPTLPPERRSESVA